ncbi:hypothetical protein JTB14_030988 [Gonioctena quinquepunctata]|nr:hypothetical protein JTB14_030988 [Gonioctena quinquepunctata]
MKGAVQELIKTATHARKCPCYNHILNNSVAKSSKVSHHLQKFVGNNEEVCGICKCLSQTKQNIQGCSWWQTGKSVEYSMDGEARRLFEISY